MFTLCHSFSGSHACTVEGGVGEAFNVCQESPPTVCSSLENDDKARTFYDTGMPVGLDRAQLQQAYALKLEKDITMSLNPDWPKSKIRNPLVGARRQTESTRLCFPERSVLACGRANAAGIAIRSAPLWRLLCVISPASSGGRLIINEISLPPL